MINLPISQSDVFLNAVVPNNPSIIPARSPNVFSSPEESVQFQIVPTSGKTTHSICQILLIHL